MCAQSLATGASASAPQEQRTLVGWFLEQVRTNADRPALHFRSGDRYAAITWRQFGDASGRVAGFLVGEKVKPKSQVAIWSNNRPEWHIADAGILSAGCVPVPVYLTSSAEEGAYVLRHSDSRVVFVENEAILARVLEARSDLPKLRRVVVLEGLDQASPDGFVLPWEEALKRGAEALERQGSEVARRAAEVALDDIATLIYTSGTTGPPKAVQLSHGNLRASEESLSAVFEASADDRVLSYLPLAHIMERGSSEFRSYRFGNATWFVDGIDNLGLRMREVRPTVFIGVPRVWEKLAQRIQNEVEGSPPQRRVIARWGLKVARRMEERRQAGKPVSGLLRREHALAERLVLSQIRAQVGLDQAHYLLSGAAPLSIDTLRFFSSIGLPICEGYGQSENAAVTTVNRPGEIHMGTVGPACPGVDVKIAEDGEVLMRSGAVFPGYFKDEKATKEVLDAEGWLHTGDIGELDEHGCLRITDRKKDLIITAGGKNISPSNIEELLAEHELIGHAVCIGDQRPFISALLTLDAEQAASWARGKGAGGSIEDLAGNDAVRDEIAAHVKRVNSRLAQVEQVKQWEVLPGDFEIGEELTPTLKVKRSVVSEKHADTIETMYSRKKGDG